MPVQAARRANLRALIRALETAGVSQREAQAEIIGNATTGFKLQAMLDGTPIPALFAAHVEHVLCRPRGWLSEPHSENTDRLYEFDSLVDGPSACLCKRINSEGGPMRAVQRGDLNEYMTGLDRGEERRPTEVSAGADAR